MAATDFHGLQITTLFDQFSRYFSINEHIHVGVDTFIYYSEGDIKKCVAPDIFVVFGVDKYPLRRSFYTWSEGAVPTAVFEFLSDATANQDRNEKVQLYMIDIGVQEYYIHQPELKKPAEFRGWQRHSSSSFTEIVPDVQGGLFSNALNLRFQYEEQQDTHVRLLRPYLPDGTIITTSMEEQHLRKQEENLRIQEQNLRIQEQNLREEAEAMAAKEVERRKEAETLAKEESERRQELEEELKRLRAQVGNQQEEST